MEIQSKKNTAPATLSHPLYCKDCGWRSDASELPPSGFGPICPDCKHGDGLIDLKSYLKRPAPAETDVTVIIHAGHLSVDNGALYPMSVYVHLAKAVGIPTQWGCHYGDDRLTVSAEDWPVVEELLIESKLLYKMSEGESWRNVQTTTVQERLGL